jgi:hypothetical protein
MGNKKSKIWKKYFGGFVFGVFDTSINIVLKPSGCLIGFFF